MSGENDPERIQEELDTLDVSKTTHIHSPGSSSQDDRDNKQRSYQSPPPVHRKDSAQSRLHLLSDQGYHTAGPAQIGDLLEHRGGSLIDTADGEGRPGSLFETEDEAQQETSIRNYMSAVDIEYTYDQLPAEVKAQEMEDSTSALYPLDHERIRKVMRRLSQELLIGLDKEYSAAVTLSGDVHEKRVEMMLQGKALEGEFSVCQQGSVINIDQAVIREIIIVLQDIGREYGNLPYVTVLQVTLAALVKTVERYRDDQELLTPWYVRVICTDPLVPQQQRRQWLEVHHYGGHVQHLGYYTLSDYPCMLGMSSDEPTRLYRWVFAQDHIPPNDPADRRKIGDYRDYMKSLLNDSSCAEDATHDTVKVMGSEGLHVQGTPLMRQPPTLPYGTEHIRNVEEPLGRRKTMFPVSGATAFESELEFASTPHVEDSVARSGFLDRMREQIADLNQELVEARKEVEATKSQMAERDATSLNREAMMTQLQMDMQEAEKIRLQQNQTLSNFQQELVTLKHEMEDRTRRAQQHSDDLARENRNLQRQLEATYRETRGWHKETGRETSGNAPPVPPFSSGKESRVVPAEYYCSRQSSRKSSVRPKSTYVSRENLQREERRRDYTQEMGDVGFANQPQASRGAQGGPPASLKSKVANERGDAGNRPSARGSTEPREIRALFDSMLSVAQELRCSDWPRCFQILEDWLGDHGAFHLFQISRMEEMTLGKLVKTFRRSLEEFRRHIPSDFDQDFDDWLTKVLNHAEWQYRGRYKTSWDERDDLYGAMKNRPTQAASNGTSGKTEPRVPLNESGDSSHDPLDYMTSPCGSDGHVPRRPRRLADDEGLCRGRDYKAEADRRRPQPRPMPERYKPGLYPQLEGKDQTRDRATKHPFRPSANDAKDPLRSEVGGDSGNKNASNPTEHLDDVNKRLDELSRLVRQQQAIFAQQVEEARNLNQTTGEQLPHLIAQEIERVLPVLQPSRPRSQSPTRIDRQNQRAPQPVQDEGNVSVEEIEVDGQFRQAVRPRGTELERFEGNTKKQPYLVWRMLATGCRDRHHMNGAEFADLLMKRLGGEAAVHVNQMMQVQDGGRQMTGNEIIAHLDNHYYSVATRRRVKRLLATCKQQPTESLLYFCVRVRKACYTCHFDEPTKITESWRAAVRDGVGDGDAFMLQSILDQHDTMDACINAISTYSSPADAESAGWTHMLTSYEPYSAEEVAIEYLNPGRVGLRTYENRHQMNMVDDPGLSCNSSPGTPARGDGEATIYQMLYEAYDVVGYGSTEDEMPDCYLVAEELAAMVKNQPGRIGAGSGQSYQKIERILDKEAETPNPNSNYGRRPSFFRDWLERFRREFLGELRRLLVGGLTPSGKRVARGDNNNGPQNNPRISAGNRGTRGGTRGASKSSTPPNGETEPPSTEKGSSKLACVVCDGPTDGGKPCKSGALHYCMTCRTRHPSITVLREGVRGPCMLCTHGKGDMAKMKVLISLAEEGKLN